MKKGWSEATIGELCQLATGGTPSKAKREYFEGGEIKWLVSGDVHQREIFDCEGRITESGLENSNARYLPINSVVIALNGQGKTRGTVAMLRTKATCNQSLVSIFPNDISQLLPEFLFHNLVGRYSEIRRLTGDAGNERRGLNMPLIRSIKVPVPPLEEQKRIVAILDEAFEGLARARENVEANLVEAQLLFEEQRNFLLSPDQDGFVQVTVGDVCPRFEYGSSAKSKPNGPVPVLRMGNIQKGELDWSDLVFSDDKNEIERYRLNPGDVLFNRTNSAEHVGKTAIYDGSRPAIFAGYLIRVHRDENRIDGEYLTYYLNSRRAREYGATVMGRSVNQANISAAKLREYPLPLPSLKKQREIVDALNATRQATSELTSAYKAKLESLDTLKQSLFHKAFSGQLT